MTELEDLTAQLKAINDRLDAQKKEIESLPRKRDSCHGPECSHTGQTTEQAAAQAASIKSGFDEMRTQIVDGLKPEIAKTVRECVGDECKPLREEVQRTATALKAAGYSTIPGIQRARAAARQASEQGQPAPTFVQCPHPGCGGALVGNEVACPSCGNALSWVAPTA